MSHKKIWIGIVIFLFLSGAAGSYFYLRNLAYTEKRSEADFLQKPASGPEDHFALRIYYPINGRLEMIEKILPKRTRTSAIAEAVIEEYFKGPGNGKISLIPQNVKLLGLYKDQNQTLYLDLSDEFRRNFQGDALSEHLLLKGLYESLISNLQDFQDVEILIEGKEIETLGGHLYLKYTLKNIVQFDLKGDKSISNE